MNSYYEILNIATSATTSEIQAAYKSRYRQVQRLLDHSDPGVAAKARQGAQLLEQIRLTLTDPAQRAAYDASINLDSSVGGLADPKASTKKAVVRPLPPRTVAKSQIPSAPDTEQRVDAWICPQCQAVSPIGTRFCKQCGQELARECPQCNRLVEVSAAFCGVCGLNVKEYVPQPDLHTELNALDDKVGDKSQSRLYEAAVSEWWRANLTTQSVKRALDSKIVMSFGMVKRGFKADLMLSIKCDQAVQVKIDTSSAWIRISQQSFGLQAGQKQEVAVAIDTARLDGGAFYGDEIVVTAQGATTVAVTHYILLGTKKFMRAGKAKKELSVQLDSILTSKVLQPLVVDDLVTQARKAVFDQKPQESAAAYARAVRLVRNPDLARSVDFYKPTALPISPQEPAYPLAQEWHKIVPGLPRAEAQPPSAPGWENWSPHVQLGTHTPFHALPLWTFDAKSNKLSFKDVDTGRRVLFPVDSNIALDALTGEPHKIAQPVEPTAVLGTEEARRWHQNEAVEGDFVVRIKGRRLVAESKSSGRVLWESSNKVGGVLDTSSSVVIGQRMVYLHRGETIAAFDRASGKMAWQDKFKPGSNNLTRYVESNGLLVAVYISPESSKVGDKIKYYPQMNIKWWSVTTGKGGSKYLGKGFQEDKHFCHAVAPIQDQSFGARVLIAHAGVLYRVNLDDQIQVTEDKLSHNFREHLYMQVLGNICLIVSSGGGSGQLEIAALGLSSRLNRAITGRYNARFSNDEKNILRYGTNEEKRKLLFDISLVGGVLILRSRFRRRDEAKILALV